MLGVIREYLVNIGYSVDTASMDSAQKSLDQVAQSVSGFLGSVKTAAEVTGFTAAITTAVAILDQFTLGVANATLQNEIFARQMWMSYNSALAFRSSLNALGVSLSDLYLSPQLMSTFIQFQNLTKQMQAPADFQDVMNNLMKITFQFDQFKLEMVYGAQWIGYYLAKDLSGPLSDFEAGLQKINTMIITKMPLWTSKVASFIAMIGSFFEDIYTAGKDVVQVWDDLGESTQRAIEMFTGVGAAVMLLSSPIGQVLALLLLLDDYFGYEKGEQSAFPGLWKGIDDIEKKLKQTGAFDEMKTAVNELAESLIGKDGKGSIKRFNHDISNYDNDPKARKRIVNYLTASKLISQGIIKEDATLGGANTNKVYSKLEDALNSSDIPIKFDSLNRQFRLPFKAELESGMEFQKILNQSLKAGESIPSRKVEYLSGDHVGHIYNPKTGKVDEHLVSPDDWDQFKEAGGY